jgi:predicted ATPase
MLDDGWICKRAQKDLRRMFITLAIEDGADENLLRRATYAAPRHVMGLYNSPQWRTLCRKLMKLNLRQSTNTRRAHES